MKRKLAALTAIVAAVIISFRTLYPPAEKFLPQNWATLTQDEKAQWVKTRIYHAEHHIQTCQLLISISQREMHHNSVGRTFRSFTHVMRYRARIFCIEREFQTLRRVVQPKQNR